MFSHQRLHEQTLSAASREKMATLELLQVLQRVEDRRTYAAIGADSMFTYVRDHLGYSPSQASERIASMRLLRKVPEVASPLSDGSHTLTSVMKIANHVRRENLEPEEAKELVLELANRTVESIERHLLGISQVEPAKVERTKVISKELTRLVLDVDEEFMAEVKRMKELKGNPGIPLSEIFKQAMAEWNAKREIPPARTSESRKKGINAKAKESSSSESELLSNEKPRSRFIRIEEKRIIRRRSGDQCEFISTAGKRCSSRFGIQFEHVIPFAKGGRNQASNLKYFCPAHNRLSAINEFGEEKMRKFLR